MRPAHQTTWPPSPITSNDVALMDIATAHYDKKGSYIINRCQLFLQVISIYDLFFGDCLSIHPSYMKGLRHPYRISDIAWPDFPSPPNNYWSSWSHFYHFHIVPIMNNLMDLRKPNIPLCCTSCFYKHRFTPHVYQLCDQSLT
jgi:hypothetical protein